MPEVVRDLWRLSGPTLLKQGHLELLAQDHVPVGPEYLKGRRLHNLSNLCQ